MYKQRYYVLVYQGNGTLSLVGAWFGPFERHFFPVQMLDERMRALPQPWPDQPGTVRNPRLGINTGMWFVNLQDPPRRWFRWQEITELLFQRIGANPSAYWWDGAEVRIRPGHTLNDARTIALPIDSDYLTLAHMAYATMPLYQVRRWAKERPEDFPDILKAGLFHPWWKEPEPVTIHPSFRAKRIALTDMQELTVQQRHRTQAGLAVEIQKQANGLVIAPTGYLAGMGMN